MGVRIKGLANVQSASQLGQTEVVDSSFDQREVTVDGQTIHFGPNEVKNFADEGVGAAVAAFRSGEGAEGIVEDTVVTENPRF